jgi:hypothetical protein
VETVGDGMMDKVRDLAAVRCMGLVMIVDSWVFKLGFGPTELILLYAILYFTESSRI